MPPALPILPPLKGEPGWRVPPTCHCNMKGTGCHPAGARSARPSRPPCSDRREGCCRLVGREKVNWAEGPREAGLGHDSARRFFGFRDLGAPSLCIRPIGRTRKREILRRCAPQDDNIFVILSGTKWSEESRAGAPVCSRDCKQILSPICGETHKSESNHTHPARAAMRGTSIRHPRRKQKEKTAFQSENGPFCILL